MPKASPSQVAITTVQVAHGADCVLARQRAKQISELLGFNRQDQTRIATAVSEIARNAFEYAGGGRVVFSIQEAPFPEMWITVTDSGKGIPHIEEIWSGVYQSKVGLGLGLVGARRLMDDFTLATSGQGTEVRLGKKLDALAAPPIDLPDITARLARISGTDPRLQLRDENQELLGLLEALREREGELGRVNAELEETNRGVLALYAELEDKAESLRAASEAKSHFLSMVSHELRTPLNSIVSLSRLLLEHTDGDLTSEQEKQIQFMLRSANGLSELVTDLLDLAKIEAGRTELKQATFTVGDVLAALRGMFRPLVTTQKVGLVFGDECTDVRLYTDEGKVAQILRNLISNALKFTVEGTVTISAAWDGRGTITFAVADTGIGIAPEHHATIFEEWGQVTSAQGPHGRGSGLGLPLSRKLAELLGGSLTFTSSYGEGSTFVVSLPTGTEPDSQSDDDAPAGAGLILVADDDEVARYVLIKQLKPLTRAEIVEVGDGVEALRLARTLRPSLLFLDLLMPGLNGEEILQQLHSDPDTSSLPIAIITSHELDAGREASLRTKALDIFGKDAEPGEEQRVQLERVLLTAGLRHDF